MNMIYKQLSDYCNKKFGCSLEVNPQRFKDSHPSNNASLLEINVTKPIIVSKKPDSVQVIWSILHEIGHLFVRRYTYIDKYKRNIAIWSLKGFRKSSKTEKIICGFNLWIDELLAWIFAYFLTYKFKVKRKGFIKHANYCISTYYQFIVNGIKE